MLERCIGWVVVSITLVVVSITLVVNDIKQVEQSIGIRLKAIVEHTIN